MQIISDEAEISRKRFETLDSSFNGGVVSTDDIVMKFNKNYHKSFTLKVLEEVITSLPIVIYFRKNSYLVKTFDEKLGAIKSAGLVSYWTEIHLQPQFSKLKDVKVGPKKITVKTLKGAFQIIASGLLLSFLVFVFELVSNFIRKW